MSLTTEEEIENRRKQDESRLPTRDDARWLRDVAKEDFEYAKESLENHADIAEYEINYTRMNAIAARIDDLWNMDLAALLADCRRHRLQQGDLEPQVRELQERNAHLERVRDLADVALQAEKDRRRQDRETYKEKLRKAGMEIARLLKSDAVLGQVRRALDAMRQKMQIMVTNADNMTVLLLNTRDRNRTEHPQIKEFQECAGDFTTATMAFDAIAKSHVTAGDEHDMHITRLLEDNNKYQAEARAARAKLRELETTYDAVVKELVEIKDRMSATIEKESP